MAINAFLTHSRFNKISCDSEHAASAWAIGMQWLTSAGKELRSNGYPKAFIDSSISTHTHVTVRLTTANRLALCPSPTSLVSVRTSGESVDVSTSGWLSGQACLSDRCSPRSRILFPSSYNRGWCTGYLAPAGKPTSVRPRGDWKRDSRNNEMTVANRISRAPQLLIMPGSPIAPSNGRKPPI